MWKWYNGLLFLPSKQTMRVRFPSSTPIESRYFMQDSKDMFTKVFDNSDIVKQWKERGFEHIGTIFLGNDYDIAFPMDSGMIISKTTYLRNIEFDMEMLDLIYKTKQYIRDLAATCNALCGKVD